MHVTKTISNLTKYCKKKPGDSNGTIIFKIDFMKNSSPLNLKFTFFATIKTKNQNNTSFLLDSQHSQLSFRVNQNKEKPKICEKVKFNKDLN